MRAATAKCLRDGFCADSMAYVRYLLYSQKAKEENFPSIAHLFRALALSRYTRASVEYHLVNELIGTHGVSGDNYFTFARTMDNMERARDAENGDASETLPAYAAVAESQGEEAAARSLKRSAMICLRRAALLEDVILKTKHAAKSRRSTGCTCAGPAATSPVRSPPGMPACGTDRAGFIAVT